MQRNIKLKYGYFYYILKALQSNTKLEENARHNAIPLGKDNGYNTITTKDKREHSCH